MWADEILFYIGGTNGINCCNGYGCNHNKLDQAYFKQDVYAVAK